MTHFTTETLWGDLDCPVIGMVHLPPLPGSPAFSKSLQEIILRAIQDAEFLAAAGCDGLMIENFGDVPFFPHENPPVTIAAMTSVAVELRRRFALPLGINVLRNDGVGALSVALAAEASFIRVNVLAGAVVADQGIIQGIAATLLRRRKEWGGERIAIWGDIRVKHAVPFGEGDVEDEVHDLIDRGMADALIVTGRATGSEPNPREVGLIRNAARPTPVFVGSGITVENVDKWMSLADGIIVGSSLKYTGRAGFPVELERAASLMQRVKQVRRERRV